jgi:hypothetical protein
MNRFLFLCIAPAIVCAADFFPLDQGNGWTFSYESRSTVIIPNSPITHDSGAVQWKILYGLANSVVIRTYIQETRTLSHRTFFNDTELVYDSIYSPPRTILDTIVLQQGVALTQTGRTSDSIKNAISFYSAECPVALHDPAKPQPAELEIKDTAVQFNGSTLSCKKTIPSECSCLDGNAWSFVLADSIGPVEMSISRCPGLAGTGYSETRHLISRTFPASIRENPYAPTRSRGTGITVSKRGIRVTQPLGAEYPISIALFDAAGKVMKKYSGIPSGPFMWNSESMTPGIYILRGKTRAGNVTQKIWLQKYK